MFYSFWLFQIYHRAHAGIADNDVIKAIEVQGNSCWCQSYKTFFLLRSHSSKSFTLRPLEKRLIKLERLTLANLLQPGRSHDTQHND
jgi:hypothetical protein